jgi:myosin-5
VGKSKVFLRKGAVQELEHLRQTRLGGAACRIQARIRTWLVQRRVAQMCQLALKVQSLVRGRAARRVLQSLRVERAAVRVQTAWRSCVARHALAAARHAATKIACSWKMHCARTAFVKHRRESRATRV